MYLRLLDLGQTWRGSKIFYVGLRNVSQVNIFGVAYFYQIKIGLCVDISDYHKVHELHACDGT